MARILRSRPGPPTYEEWLGQIQPESRWGFCENRGYVERATCDPTRKEHSELVMSYASAERNELDDMKNLLVADTAFGYDSAPIGAALWEHLHRTRPNHRQFL